MNIDSPVLDDDSESEWKASNEIEKISEDDNESPQGEGDDDDDDDEHQSKKKSSKSPEIIVKILSAQYGPCEGKRLITGELSNDETASIPYTRDVAPFLRALLVAQQHREMRVDTDDNEEEEDRSNNTGDDEESDPRIVRMNAISGKGGMKRTQFSVLDGMKSMNAVFGDPCPGVSKRLHVHYIVSETNDDNDQIRRAASAEAHYMSFAEHEKVILRRKVQFYQEEDQIKRAAARALAKKLQDRIDNEAQCKEEDEDVSTLNAARRMGRAQSISEFAEEIVSLGGLRISTSKAKLLGTPQWQHTRSSSFGDLSSPLNSANLTSNSQLRPLPPRKWRLRSATSEIVLPMVMPFLEVKERVHCELVCSVWRNIIRDWGVATTIDNNDPAFPRFTRPFLRGILSHSHASLHSLFLSNFEDLQKSDLHPAIPYLRQLRSLDISRCVQLDDSTLQLLSEHASDTLEVLYIKGLRNVSDVGVISICRSCSKLKVLEISNVPISDEGGIAIGEHLTKLRAIYMRDNYLLTNRSIDVITEKCTYLEQLTLWGCTRMRHLSFDQPKESSVFTSGKLMMLNLWGCHSLRDDSANALVGMSNLRSLIVSECHRLTDNFFMSLARDVPQLMHLYLRYCKRVTDAGVDAITHSMQDLYFLDLSFCTKITASALFSLLEVRGDSLAELRLQSCHKLDITRDANSPAIRRAHEPDEGGQAGRQILSALKSHGDRCCLSVLDVRRCGGQPSPDEYYPETDPFVQGMTSLEFEQRVPGYFSRPARWNQDIERRLVEQMVSERRAPVHQESADDK